MVNMLLFGIVDMIILKEFKKLFILTNLSKNLSFIFIINTLMLFDIIGFIQKKSKFSNKFIYIVKPHVAKFRKKLKKLSYCIELYFKHDNLFTAIFIVFSTFLLS